MTESLSIGRGRITSELVFIGEVSGGGAVGPGKVAAYTDFNKTSSLYFFRDDRSGSKRSGSCSWQLQADRLYVLSDIAVSSRAGDTFYVSTFDCAAKELSRAEFEAERARIWPLAKLEAEEEAERRRVAEQDRIVREAAEAERRRIEKEALAEFNAEKAAEIAAQGQPKVEGLPELTGTPKQIAYALSIREAFANRYPEDAALKRGTTAKYWIENHRSMLFR
ncbi:MAG TPA: hypothetical protein VIL30_26405 [Ramlibacter sp.]|jgi:hypothetical protein